MEYKVRYVVIVPQMAMVHGLGRERQNNADTTLGSWVLAVIGVEGREDDMEG